MFKKAIVRTPGKSMVNGISTADLGRPDHELALAQHADYIEALKECGLEVTVLDADEEYPDSTFVEDVALLTRECAIITNPGADSRRGEIIAMKNILEEFYTNIEEIHEPGHVEAGDIMIVGDHFYIGLSERTNQSGADQMIEYLKKYGMSGSTVELKKVLHLKTGLAYLENNNLIASGEFLAKEDFQKFNILAIDEGELAAANCIWVNGTVIMPKGYPKARATIEAAGYKIREVDVSEYQKLDGGLSCLSLRF
ncbi:MAG: N(G),N(G)-dimethylarginine dimethylaminohydrolase [Anaerolineae bacterium]|jgi:dimethylargininase|nr:N(G),N(G)-dimethylarginine dimethylaminohydrolase [Anaerolineae bacterium]MBT3714492.1 N(G),N(G)-dimethylarginine dimethylaminohydrolase [Anaerolineae bacterium]MBT4312697.1 N(G),N(G)-dimethylarginine dimethylaminohydrolase [Anaerolineae bacterium]MBT4458572.1 N(G),N(G)-dimethylarginine dimethylaminohydrolase [Anaerolineae bacterium]MBT4843374.1 N(G),N(G)-dimethylarginine dimethylaminohydrolase [Anaerolineae bacterium]